MQLKSFINSYIEEIESCFANDTIRLYYSDDWNDLLEGTISGARSSIVVEPLIKTKWNQSWSNDSCDMAAYNYFIPPDDGHHCLHQLVGCGAVALAQVMNYWQYPILYNAPQQFDWCSMTDSLNKCRDDNYESHRDAISHLMYRCAEDIGSIYGCSETRSNLENSRNALVQMYGYDNSAFHSNKFPSQYVNNWINLIKANLDAKMPVLYRGSSSNGGHAFICDGYRDDDMFHFNWGWNGQCDGYFALTSLNPSGANHTGRQAAIFNIKPRTTTSICCANLNLEDYYYDNTFLLNNYHPHEITPQTMTTLTSAAAPSPSSWRTIPAGVTACYNAHEEIAFQDGFEAQLGCEFEARIEPCEKCGGQRGDGLVGDDESDYDNDNDGLFDNADYAVGSFEKTVTNDLFPNPTDGPLTMATEGMAEAVFVHDMTGHPVGSWHLEALTEDLVTLNVSSLHAGPYLLTVVTPSGACTARFIRR